MKRFHVHLHVADLNRSIAFYSRLFDAAPVRVESDYAKWMLEDPAVNFAVSSRSDTLGLDHLGFQTDEVAELAAMKARATAADMSLLDEGETTCCYARSEKHWVTDPEGIAWEHFHTLENIPVFHEATRVADGPAVCCAASPGESTSAQQAVSRYAPDGSPAPSAAGKCC
jgi:catechol 2,3-dioxygenase-like lactoylglutathione lyase family enzyme